MSPIAHGPDTIDVSRFRRTFILALVLAISALFLALVQNFVTAVFLAAIFSAMCRPAHRWLTKVFRGRESLAAGTTILLVLVVLVVPSFFFVGIVAGQAVEVSQQVRPWVEQQLSAPSRDAMLARFEMPEFLEPYEAEILKTVGELASGVGGFLVDSLAAVTKGTAVFFFHLFVMLYAMFFFLQDGPNILRKLLYYMPLESRDENRMVVKFVSVTRATIKGTLVIGIVQGGLAGAAFAVAGITGAAFWGTVMAVLSIIPGVGTALVWVPAAIWLAATGSVGPAVGLAAWCLLVVGTADNVLRPTLVGRDTQMSDLLILLSTLGGLLFFGALGIVVGPIVAALFVTVWEIYGEAFASVLPEADLPGGETPPEEPATG